MATLSDFLPEVLVEVPDVPDVVAEHHIRNAIIDFCQRSTYYRADLAFNTVADQAQYTSADFTLPADTRIVEIYDGRLGTDRSIYRKTPGQLETEVGYDWASRTGDVYYVTREDTESLTLVRVPTTVKAVVIKAALKPTQTATTVDDLLYNDWHELIAIGALARIYKIPNKVWSDNQTALMNAGLFENGIMEAKRRVENAHMKPSRTVHYGGI